MAGSPKITILSEQLRGKVFELTKDTYTVGRIEERDICIMDPTISTYHGSFIKNGNTYIIKDNNSTNGTRVNNVPVMEQELKNSDIIQLGDVEMLYDCDEKANPADKTSNITGISLKVNPTSSSSIKKLDAISPYAEKNKADSKKSQKIIFLLIGLLVLVVVVLLGFVGYKMFGPK